jgi:hypothetical protein
MFSAVVLLAAPTAPQSKLTIGLCASAALRQKFRCNGD